MTIEHWKCIPGYEHLYQASDEGRIKSLRTGKVMRPGPHNGGYKIVHLYRDGKTVHLVHRLVMAAFNGPIPGAMEVNHKNGDKRDNRLVNLEMVSRSENILHRLHTLNMSPGRRAKGSEHPHSKATEAVVLQIRGLYVSGMSQSKLAANFGLSRGAIAHIVRRESWTHI